MVLGAVQRDQHARAQALEGREPARALQLADHVLEHGTKVIGRDRVEHAADVAVTGDAAHPEQSVGVGAAVPGRKLALVGQKRGALGEEHRECGQAEVGQGLGAVVAPARVREALAAAPHGADQALEHLHDGVEMTALK